MSPTLSSAPLRDAALQPEAALKGTGFSPYDSDIKKEGALALKESRRVLFAAAFHSLLWLVIANAVGCLLAAMLLFPQLNTPIAPWTYGRWMPVHLNLQLYGWCSLPLVAFLFRVYGADRGRAAAWASPTLWIWSAALAIGSVSWLTGHSSGKLFLDWSGYPRVLFPLAMLALWALLTYALTQDRHTPQPLASRITKLTGLALLLLVPALLYIAADPSLYPPINPDTGGPTGASQLESTLIIVAILLLIPFGLTETKSQATTRRPKVLTVAWLLFAAETLLCLGLGRADISHHRPTQWIALGSLLVWIPLIPAYFAQFHWHANTRTWRIAFLAWWAILVPTGWTLFLPGVLDRFKFTDGLVGHSLLAMAGFISSLLIFVLVQLLGDDGWIFTKPWSFTLWHASVLAYVVIMFIAGWQEGANPAFSMVPGPLRNTIYDLRLILGILIFIASADWLLDALRLRSQLQQETLA